MEEVALARSDGIRTAVKRKRSQISRRPKDSNELADHHDHSSLSISPPSDDLSKSSSGENAPKRKKFSLNQLVARASSATGSESENAFSGSNSGRSAISKKRSTEGVLAPVNWRSTSKLKECVDVELRTSNMYGGRNGESWSSEQWEESLDALGNESRVKKVKLKVGGVTHTVHSNSTTNGVSSTKNSQSSDASRSRQKNGHQENIDKHSVSSKKRSSLQGVPWKDFSRGGFSLGRADYLMGKTSSKNISGKQGDKSESVRKSKRLPKRRYLGVEIDEDSEDDEIRYLEKLKLKVTTRQKEDNSDDDDESIKEQHKLSTMNRNGASRVAKDGTKRSKPDQALEDTHYKEVLLSDSELEGSKTMKQKKESVELLMDRKQEMTLTTRQRALQSSKDGSSVPGSNLIEFPNGLPPAPPRKQKEKLSEVEEQLKKTEAAQRRRMQVEKAARESEAEAIRKILGQDSSRKKREEKQKKRREELAEEKAASALTLASNTIRWVMGPTGTVLTFPKDMDLPSIFDSKPSSYPPPREKCAGPSCTNPYRYRDSKSKLPLCSLQCYKAIHEQRQSEINC